jgi:hypothetical protein
VLQSNTSIALEEGEEASFEVHRLPAMVFNDQLLFEAQGEFYMDGGDRIRMQMIASTASSRVSGSLVAPLEHFVILGTANYASKKEGNSRFAIVVQTVETQSFAPEK